MDLFGKKLNAESGHYGKKSCPHKGIKPQEKSQANASERCMGDAAADEDNPPCDDVSSCNPCRNAGKKGGQQGFLEKSE